MKLNEFVAIAKEAMDEMRSKNFEIDLMDCEFLHEKQVRREYGAFPFVLDKMLFVNKQNKTIITLSITLIPDTIKLMEDATKLTAYDINAYHDIEDLIHDIVDDTRFGFDDIRDLYYNLIKDEQ